MFRTPAAWVEIHLAIEPGRLRFSAVAPESGHRVAVETAIAAEPLRNWDPSYRLALGGELTNERSWLGEIRQARVRTDGTAIDYAADARATLEASPPRFWYARQYFTLVPFRDFNLHDAFVNVVGYVPLGLLFGVWGWLWGGARRGWRRSVALVLAVAVVSATLETLQFFVPVRHPSTTDLVLNTLGGGIGVLLVEWARAAGLEIYLRR